MYNTYIHHFCTQLSDPHMDTLLPDKQDPQVLHLGVLGQIASVTGVGVEASGEDRHAVVLQPGHLQRSWISIMWTASLMSSLLFDTLLNKITEIYSFCVEPAGECSMLEESPRISFSCSPGVSGPEHTTQ